MIVGVGPAGTLSPCPLPKKVGETVGRTLFLGNNHEPVANQPIDRQYPSWALDDGLQVVPESVLINLGLEHKSSLVIRRITGPTRRSTKGQWTAEEERGKEDGVQHAGCGAGRGQQRALRLQAALAALVRRCWRRRGERLQIAARAARRAVRNSHDAILYRAVQSFKGKHWKKIAECFPDRTDVQCLHRWQKVLNPELVKGPWSKEEDEIIIDMVKKFGPKKWSAIAQALPGRIGKQCRERTDNAIKNHWNSSVKKKINLYLASGLLSEFQGLPHTKSSAQVFDRQKSNANGLKDMLEVEDSTECSQTSTANVGCSQSDENEKLAIAASVDDDMKLDGDISRKDILDSHLSKCMNDYYAYMEDFACAVPEEQSKVSASANLLLTEEISEKIAEQASKYDLPNNSTVEVSQKPSGLTEASECHSVCRANKENGSVSCPTFSDVKFPNFVSDNDSAYEKQSDLLVCETGCFSNNLSGLDVLQGGIQECPIEFDDSSFGNLDYYSGTICQNSFSSEACKSLTSCPNPVSSSGMLGISYGDNLVAVLPPYSCGSDGRLYTNSILETRDISVEAHDSDVIICSYDGIAYSSCSSLCPSDGSKSKFFLPEDKRQEIGAPNQTNTAMMVSATPNTNHKAMSSDENLSVQSTDLSDSGALFYEPPRFPSLEIPFISCDLISSGDPQQAYSPLGIRQLMMSSVNCSKPYSLWDSPSHDESPDAHLKGAAKSFMYTPSILKKRQREMSSPIPEQRTDKKPGKDMARVSLCASPVNDAENSFMVNVNDEVIFNEIPPGYTEAGFSNPSDKQHKVPVLWDEDKENLCQSSGYATAGDVMEAKTPAISYGKMASFTLDASAASKVDTGASKWRPPRILIECNANNKVFFSPCGTRYPTNGSLNVGAKSLKVHTLRSSENASNFGQLDDCAESLFDVSALFSPRVSENKDSHCVSIISEKSDPSAHPSPFPVEKCSSTVDDDIRHLNIFVDTPGTKRGIESPSAWKSPWFVNSLLPVHGIGTDTAFEDMGYLMSPGDQSYDAIGLMRQLSEHTAAAAVAEAQEVLTSGSPVRTCNEPQSDNKKFSDENADPDDKELGNHHMPSKIMTEARVLDFSGCGTPVNKRSENVKAGNTETPISLSSQSSYLMKVCR
ncbi:hypothetical protein MUK42_14582 [Musa troglodytarum]|uniref:Uncharacterized protein n=1 Tax=Musa troglodytarum TaxID=320322 RepID=A0A9E7I9U6_9LILI|nr:hypothetical protein MUK42_14582 [Musa troglodytarum]